jgi:hypothetical protein
MVFRSDHIAGTETAGHASRRRTLHHETAPEAERDAEE